MNRNEVAELLAEINGHWPHAQLPTVSLPLWIEECSDLAFDQARAAVKAHLRSGERFPPTAGQVRAAAVELDRDLPEWPEIQAEITRLHRKGFSTYRSPAAEDYSSPLVAHFVAEIGWRRFCIEGYDLTFAAQTRDAWRAFAGRIRRDDALTGLPAAGLRRLARVNGGPRQLGDALRDALPNPERTAT